METGLGFALLKIVGLLGEWIGWMLLALAFIARKSRGSGRFVAATLLITSYLLAIPLGRNLLCEPLERPFPIPSAAAITAFQPQAVVVLGGGVTTSPLQGDTLSPNPLRRLNAAWRLARDLNLPLIASGGSIHSLHTEAELMIEQALIWGGIPEAIAESRSATTLANARQTHRLLAERHIERILLVTSGVHMRRSVRAFDLEGISLLPVPADPRWSEPTGWLFEITPTTGTLNDSASAIHEWIGYLVGR